MREQNKLIRLLIKVVYFIIFFLRFWQRNTDSNLTYFGMENTFETTKFLNNYKIILSTSCFNLIFEDGKPFFSFKPDSLLSYGFKYEYFRPQVLGGSYMQVFTTEVQSYTRFVIHIFCFRVNNAILSPI